MAERKKIFSKKNYTTLSEYNFNESHDVPILFASIIKTNETPINDLIKDGDFVEVVYKKKPFWALFKCPCGCQSIITLPLQKVHNPSWALYETQNGRPSVSPSIWQNKGCCSHFWINDGKVFWCENTGNKPYLMMPSGHSKLKKRKAHPQSRKK